MNPEDLSAHRLPRGRHGLPHELVAENQRLRLLAAAGEVLAVRGVNAVSSRQIATRAGVSSSTFYVHFEDVDACLAAAHSMAADALWELISAACEGAGAWSEGLRVALEAAAEFLRAEPSLARLLCLDLAAAVPAVGVARSHLLERLAGLLSAAGAPRAAAEQSVPAVDLHLTAAAAAMLSEPIAAGELDRLAPLVPELSEILATATAWAR